MGAFREERNPATDQEEYNNWVKNNGGQGVGELIYDDPDDARDAAEFAELTGVEHTTV